MVFAHVTGRNQIYPGAADAHFGALYLVVLCPPRLHAFQAVPGDSATEPYADGSCGVDRELKIAGTWGPGPVAQVDGEDLVWSTRLRHPARSRPPSSDRHGLTSGAIDPAAVPEFASSVQTWTKRAGED